MRAQEFLTEASVFKKEKNQYVPGYRMAISTKGGGKSIELVTRSVPDFDKNEELTVVSPETPSTVTVQLARETPVSFKLKRSNGQVIELTGTENSIESSLNGIGPAANPDKPNEVKMPNKGDTAEALLGASMFAKMLNREGKQIGDITTDTVWNILDTMKPVTNDDYLVTAKDLGGATDKIWFKMKVKGYVKMALQNPAMRKKLTAWLMSPVNYVNSDEGTEYANEFYKNGQPDEIGVISDGLSAQSDKKTDVYMAVRDDQTGNVKKELLPISLKAGADQFAQHSGSSWKAMEEMFKHLGVTFTPNEKLDLKNEYESKQSAKQQVEAADQVYSVAAGIINDKFRSPQDEAAFIKTVANALKFWATSNQTNVRLVTFGNRGAYEVLRFDRLVPMMKKLQLRAEHLTGTNPKLLVKDQVTGQILFQIRTYIQQTKKGPYQRNIIEKGPLISTVASAIEKKAPVEKPETQKVGNVVSKTPKPLGRSDAVPSKVPTKAATTQPADELDPTNAEDPTVDNELNRVKKNAGIAVE